MTKGSTQVTVTDITRRKGCSRQMVERIIREKGLTPDRRFGDLRVFGASAVGIIEREVDRLLTRRAQRSAATAAV